MDHSPQIRLLREFNLSSEYRNSDANIQISRTGIVCIRRRTNPVTISILDTIGKTENRIVAIGSRNTVLKFTRDGNKVIGYDKDSRLAIWDANIVSMEKTLPLYNISDSHVMWQAISVNDNGERLLVRNQNNQKIIIYDIRDGKMIACIKDSARYFFLASIPDGDDLLVAIKHEKTIGDGPPRPVTRFMIFDVATGEKMSEHYLRLAVRSVRDTRRKNEYIMIVRDTYTTSKCRIVMLTIESSTKISMRDIISGLVVNIDYLCEFVENERGVTLACATMDGMIILYDSNGGRAEIDGLARGQVDMEFTEDGRRLITRDRKSVRVHDSCILPFWSMTNHSLFPKEQRKCIKFILCINKISSHTKKRKRQVLSEVPKEIMLHILSFVGRDY